uniref:LisH domain-containing protein n=1 Tax=Strongyloides venezuelensis TaxID=75913 RepID=A0A0K0FN69_STRVS
MVLPYLNPEFERSVRNEAESLFADYLSRHKFTKTLDAFMKESNFCRNNSQSSNRSYLQSSYSSIEDMIMNVNFGDNANRKYLFSTCKSFVDIIAENSHRLINFICENSAFADGKNGLNEFKSEYQIPHPFFNEGNINNNGSFIRSPVNVHSGNYLHDNSTTTMPYETVYNPPRYVSNRCNSNTLPNLNNATSYSHTSPPMYYRTESFALNPSRLNGFRPMDGSRVEGSVGRVSANGDVLIDHNGRYMLNNSSNQRIVSDEPNNKKRNIVVLQGGSFATPNCYANTNQQFVRNNENHANSTQYSGQQQIEDNRNVYNDNGMPVLSNHSANFSTVVSSNRDVEVKEKRSRTNVPVKSTVKVKSGKEGSKVSSSSKRKTNSSCDGSGKKMQKFGDENNGKTGLLDFQTTLNTSQFRKAAKDVDLLKEPHLAKKYSSEFNQTGKSFKPENLLNISKFKNDQGQGSNHKKEQSFRSLPSPSMNIPGFGRRISDDDSLVLDKNYVFKSPTKISPPDNDSLGKGISLIDTDTSNISSFKDKEDSNYSKDLESPLDDITGIQDPYYPYELCQDNSLGYNSDGVFDLDSNMFFDPGRDLELFDEIGYCKNDG